MSKDTEPRGIDHFNYIEGIILGKIMENTSEAPKLGGGRIRRNAIILGLSVGLPVLLAACQVAEAAFPGPTPGPIDSPHGQTSETENQATATATQESPVATATAVTENSVFGTVENITNVTIITEPDITNEEMQRYRDFVSSMLGRELTEEDEINIQKFELFAIDGASLGSVPIVETKTPDGSYLHAGFGFNSAQELVPYRSGVIAMAQVALTPGVTEAGSAEARIVDPDGKQLQEKSFLTFNPDGSATINWPFGGTHQAFVFENFQYQNTVFADSLVLVGYEPPPPPPEEVVLAELSDEALLAYAPEIEGYTKDQVLAGVETQRYVSYKDQNGLIRYAFDSETGETYMAGMSVWTGMGNSGEKVEVRSLIVSDTPLDGSGQYCSVDQVNLDQLSKEYFAIAAVNDWERVNGSAKTSSMNNSEKFSFIQKAVAQLVSNIARAQQEGKTYTVQIGSRLVDPTQFRLWISRNPLSTNARDIVSTSETANDFLVAKFSFADYLKPYTVAGYNDDGEYAIRRYYPNWGWIFIGMMDLFNSQNHKSGVFDESSGSLLQALASYLGDSGAYGYDNLYAENPPAAFAPLSGFWLECQLIER